MAGIKIIQKTIDDEDESNDSKLHKGFILPNVIFVICWNNILTFYLPKSSPLIIFGKDVRKIKCFRDSFICGICCGITGGLATFLVTSKTLFSTHLAFASLWIGVFGYWIPCRHRYETNQLVSDKLKLK